MSSGDCSNYHAAIAGGGQLAEWPMPDYPLRHEMVIVPWTIEQSQLTIPEIPGLGVKLTKGLEGKYPFREDAVYQCNAWQLLIRQSRTFDRS